MKKRDAHMIALHGSKEYIQAVIEELQTKIDAQMNLAIEVSKLNPDSTEIGAGMVANLRELAAEIIWD